MLPDSLVHDNLDFRIYHTPALFRFKASTSLQAVTSAISQHTTTASPQQKAIVKLILEHQPLADCIAYLPQLIRFQAYIQNWYHKRITADEAKSTTLDTWLNSLAFDTDRVHWRQEFTKVKQCWNKAASFVEQAFANADEPITIDRIDLNVRSTLISGSLYQN